MDGSFIDILMWFHFECLDFNRLQITQLQHRLATDKRCSASLHMYRFLLLVTHEQRLSSDMERLLREVQEDFRKVQASSEENKRRYKSLKMFINAYSSIWA